MFNRQQTTSEESTAAHPPAADSPSSSGGNIGRCTHPNEAGKQSKQNDTPDDH